jgi:hypothetical protein
VSDGLPPGWTLERLHERLPSAQVLDPTSHYLVADDATGGYMELAVAVLVQTDDTDRPLCLALEAGTDDWFMGMLDPSDGSVVCWGRVAHNLDAAIDGL